MSVNRRASGRRPNWPKGAGRPLVSPLQPSAVYTASDPDALDAIYEGREPGYTYAREAHPNADVLARMIDDLEGRPGGMTTGSGMAAISAALLGTLKSGDHVIGGDQLYGRTLRLLRQDLPRLGVDCSLVDACNAKAVSAAIKPQTKLIIIEVVANPTLRIADVKGIAEIARESRALLVVDNTFTTPLGFDAWDAGADILIHSVTKLLAGHSDVTLGYVAARDPEVSVAISDAISTWGLTPSAFDCWMAERGLLSFSLRYERACHNAAALADALAEMSGVSRVIYPSRDDHPDSHRAAALNVSGGNMVSFEIEDSREAAVRLTHAIDPVAFAPTLGDINTTLSHPASSSHRAMSSQERAEIGISEGFFRVSVGVEDIDALIGDFRRAVHESTG